MTGGFSLSSVRSVVAVMTGSVTAVDRTESGVEPFVSETVGQRIARFRGDIGMSQAALARQIGKTPAFMSLIESGRRKVTEPTAVVVARALGATVGELFGEVADQMTDDEIRVLQGFRRLPSHARADVLDYVAFKQRCRVEG